MTKEIIMPLIPIVGTLTSSASKLVVYAQHDTDLDKHYKLMAEREAEFTKAVKKINTDEADWLEKWSNGVTRTMQQDYDLLAHIAELREGK